MRGDHSVTVYYTWWADLVPEVQVNKWESTQEFRVGGGHGMLLTVSVCNSKWRLEGRRVHARHRSGFHRADSPWPFLPQESRYYLLVLGKQGQEPSSAKALREFFRSVISLCPHVLLPPYLTESIFYIRYIRLEGTREFMGFCWWVYLYFSSPASHVALGKVPHQSLSSDTRDSKSTVGSQFLQETGHRALTDAHVRECLSPFLLRQVFGGSLSTFSWIRAVVSRLLTTWLLCCIV